MTRFGWCGFVCLLSSGIYSALAQRAMADPNTLVEVDGTAAACVVNDTQGRNHPQTHPGNAVAFATAKFGYCDGTIRMNCATAKQYPIPEGSNPAYIPYYSVNRTCIGNFVTVEERQSKALGDLQSRVDQQISILESDNKSLANALDALTNRLSKLEEELHHGSNPQK